MLRAFARSPALRRRFYSISTTHNISFSAVNSREREQAGSSLPSLQRPDIFEDISTEYSAVAKKFVDVSLSDQGATLVKLVEDGDYTTANSLRARLQQTGVHIEHDSRFGAAAKHALTLDDCQERPEDFVAWVVLLPNADVEPQSTAVASLVQLLLQSPEMNTNIIKAFALASASKGYVDLVRQQIIPVVARYSEEASFDTFYRAVEHNVSAFKKSIASDNVGLRDLSPGALFEDVFEDAGDEYYTAENETILDAPSTSVQSLHKLIEEGEIDRAAHVRDELRDLGIDIPPSSIFIDAIRAILKSPETANSLETFDSWSLIPDAASPTADLTATRLDLLLRYLTRRPNLRIMSHFALLCASRGYIHSTGAQMISIIIHLTDKDISSAFLQQYESNARTWLADSGESVESISHSIRSIRALSARSYCRAGWFDEAVAIVQRCEEDGMQANYDTLSFVLNFLRGSGRQDETHFSNLRTVQELLERCQSQSLPSTAGGEQAAEAPSPPFGDPIQQEVASLLQQGEYAQAEILRDEMMASGIELKPSVVYIQAAELALRRSESGQDATTNFTSWFSLVPDATHDLPVELGGIEEAILAMSPLDIPLITSYALVCASKGYGNTIYRRIFPTILRSASSSECVEFVSQFRAGTLQYPKVPIPKQQAQHLYKDILSRSIRYCITEDRVDTALELLRADGNRVNAISVATYDLLVSKLRLLAADSDAYKDVLTRVQHLRDLSVPTPRSDFVPAEEPDESIPQTDSPLIPTLRFISHSFLTPSKGGTLPLDVDILVKFIDHYRRTGRSKALLLLQKKAIRSSHRNTALWAFANMLYYHRKEDYRGVIATFTDYFFLVGVPRSQVLRVQKRWINNEWNGPKYPPQLRRGRVLPTPEHVGLAWHAIVALAHGRIKVINGLYDRLIHNVRLSKGLEIASTKSRRGATILQLRPPPNQFDRVSFTPFILAFCRYSTPEHATTVMNQMVEFGIQPGVYQLSAVACGFASRGQRDKVRMILDRMEAGDGTDLPSPNLVLYTGVMKAFIDAGCLEGAEEVERRMLMRLAYVEGMNSRTDFVRSLLRARMEEKMEQDEWRQQLPLD